MSHKDRSIANMRQEAKRIYHQRREIKRLQQEIVQLKEALENLEEINNDRSNVIASDIKEILKYQRIISEIRFKCDRYTILSAKDILDTIEKNI
jgi:hypothetical protein